MAASMRLVCVPFSWDAIAWSDDHSIAIATDRLVSIFCLQYDPRERNGESQFEKLVIRPHRDVLKFDVGIDLGDLKQDNSFNRLVTIVQTDRTLNPPLLNAGDSENSWNSVKHVRWSPACSQHFGRSLLACLSQDHRLTVNRRKSKSGDFNLVVDLSPLLHEFLLKCNFTLEGEGPTEPLPSDADVDTKCKEYRRRVYMLAAITMDWSSVMKSQSDVSGSEKGSSPVPGSPAASYLLLAVAMTSGHVVVWKLSTPVENETDVSLYSIFDSGYQWSASLSWCKLPIQLGTCYASSCACLAVGDREGRISVWRLKEGAGSGCTFSHCLDVWPDMDQISVSNMAWTVPSPSEVSAATATLVAVKGLYLLVFRIDLGSMTVVQKSHVPTQHTVPTQSLCVHENMALTTSTCGDVHRFYIDWSKKGEVLNADHVDQSNHNVKGFGIALSANGVYAACPIALRLGKRKPCKRSLNFFTVAHLEQVVKDLSDYTINLSRRRDQLEYIRQSFLSSGDSLPTELEAIAQGEAWIQAQCANDEGRARAHTLRLRRLLVLTKLSSAQSTLLKDVNGQMHTQDKSLQMESALQETEREVRKIHMVSALQSWQRITMGNQSEDQAGKGTEWTSLLLMADWLMAHDCASEDPIKSLVIWVYNAVPHSSQVQGRESCDLCGEIIPFTSAVVDACPNGHGWKRCQLSLRLCQTTSIPRACLYCEALALPVQTETASLWLREVLQECCIFCESVFGPS